MIEILQDFPGANIVVLSQTGDIVEVDVDLRDTVGDWFYWCFGVKGAGGKTLTFHFPGWVRVGYFGPAISHDREEWHWQFEDTGHEGYGFTYTFAEGEDLTYFAHHILYPMGRFEALCREYSLTPKTLAVTEEGREAPYLDIGEGDQVILLAARHHACESTGSYVLEGVLRAFLEELPRGYRILAVPFVDYDGVIHGDQGKNRRNHDHNRDYDWDETPWYATTREIRHMMETLPLKYAFDFHSPWHLGGSNDTVMIPVKNIRMQEDILAFSHLFEEETEAASLTYSAGDNIPPDTDWNTSTARCFGTYGKEKAVLSFTLETPYFLLKNTSFSPQKGLELGKCFVRAWRRFAEEKEDN